jgi:hypothetical protein
MPFARRKSGKVRTRLAGGCLNILPEIGTGHREILIRPGQYAVLIGEVLFLSVAYVRGALH